jgi:hypothetical protein
MPSRVSWAHHYMACGHYVLILQAMGRTVFPGAGVASCGEWPGICLRRVGFFLVACRGGRFGLLLIASIMAICAPT